MSASIKEPLFKEAPERKKRNRRRKQIIAAYQSYLNQEDGSVDNLLGVVREFAYMKVYHLEHEFRDMGSAETADDWAQEITLKTWLGLEKFVGSPESFYSWVHKLAYNRGVDAYKSLADQKQTMVPLMVPVKGDDGVPTDEEEDNPEIYRQSSDGGIYIPSSVTGIDLNICLTLMTGVPFEDKRTGDWKTRAKTYAEVAEELHMSEEQVTKRLSRLRRRLIAERAEQKRQHLAVWQQAKNWRAPRP